MKLRLFLLLAIITSALFLHAQAPDLPAIPKEKEEYTQTEPDFIKAAQWLENTPIGTDADKRKAINGWVVAWVSGSPTVTIELGGTMVKLFNKNPDLLAVYMAGYTRYCLENNYSKDAIKATVAGMKSVVNCYNLGGQVKKDKSLSKAIEADKNGTLTDWVKQEVMNAN